MAQRFRLSKAVQSALATPGLAYIEVRQADYRRLELELEFEDITVANIPPSPSCSKAGVQSRLVCSMVSSSPMPRLEDLKPRTRVGGLTRNEEVTVVEVTWHGSDCIDLAYRRDDGRLESRLLFRSDEDRLVLVERGRTLEFSGDGARYRLVAEAQRIQLAHLFDPYLAVNASMIEPLPHQITAVYEEMIPRQPLRFLLADDPGAGKTIMSGLLIKELMARGVVERCLIVAPGSLTEQWQDELASKFSLPFEIATNQGFEASLSGNYFVEHSLVIARLDKLARADQIQEMLEEPGTDWDLVIFDEAHKLSATYFGGEVKYTKRYRLGQLLAQRSRNLLLLTATPHNGKDEDFQLFLALLDADQFEGGYRDSTRAIDVSYLMRRAIKEQLVRFDNTPLFPERQAISVSYQLSDLEASLYQQVTDYVRQQFNRADALSDGKRKGAVGFALTILQRRLASSPEAIYQSLKRRKERLQSRARELELLERGQQATALQLSNFIDSEEIEDLEDLGDTEFDEDLTEVLDQATTARNIFELKTEIEMLERLQALASRVRASREDTKWRELSSLLGQLFRPDQPSNDKLVIFTEHRDTLRYLVERVGTYLAQPEAVVAIHGGLGRVERAKTQEAFGQDPTVKVLIATDAAGEGINLQRAHLMVNYDLPWNPNRIEQRFGRIHRIGQREVCYLWNLVASETREGDVYQLLLNKLQEAREALGGQVFDVLGKLNFDGRHLRELLIDAIRHSEQPDVKARLKTTIESALDVHHLESLIFDRALATEALTKESVFRVREAMERAEIRKLQPGYIKSFFLEAFHQLGGTIYERESGRYEITHVPASIRNRDRQLGIREPVLARYERVTFDKDLIAPDGLVQAAFLAPGHPLLQSVIDLELETDRDLLRQGTVLVDENDESQSLRVLFAVEHAIVDGEVLANGQQRVIDKRLSFIELDEAHHLTHVNYAPYLDYRPLQADDPTLDDLLGSKQARWIDDELHEIVLDYANSRVVPRAVEEVEAIRLPLLERTERAVKARLTSEITYWDHRANQLREDEDRGKVNARINADNARKRANDLAARLKRRLDLLEHEREVVPLGSIMTGAVLIAPIGLVRQLKTDGEHDLAGDRTRQAVVADRMEIAARARAIVMERERALGYVPRDVEFERLGYDIESVDQQTGSIRFIEVKGRAADSDTITVTRNEILYSLNNPGRYVLGIVSFRGDGSHSEMYLKQPFHSAPDFGAQSVNYSLAELITNGIEDNG
ncbi:MAG: SNF2-related protein [Ferrimicrobium sp.]|nr:SNF2-related protein [Ferrimicrobium sp.]